MSKTFIAQVSDAMSVAFDVDYLGSPMSSEMHWPTLMFG